MGQALRGRPGHGGEGGRTLARYTASALRDAGRLIACMVVALFWAMATPAHGAAFGRHASAPPPAPRALQAPLRLDRGRFTIVCYPTEERLARALLDHAAVSDTFPGLPRPTERVVIAIAPDARRFREWAGPDAPEWGAALAFPDSHRIVMQGRSAGSDAGDPVDVLRHELAHLALHEYLGDLPPRWFDEGYASYSARELMRNDVLAANFALAIHGMPDFDELDDQFTEGATSAQAAYALAYRAVDDMASLDPRRGLALLFRYWKATGSLDRAVREAFGMTLASFEQDWQQRTRQRYGALALFSDFTLATLIVLVLVMPLYLARRRRDRQRMADLLAADAEEAARGDAPLQGLLEGALPETDASARPDEYRDDTGSAGA